MKLYADRHSGQNLVTAHGPGWVEVNGRRHQHSLLLTPTEIDAAWGPDLAGVLAEAHIAQLLALVGNVVLLGTGARQRFPSPAILRPLIEAGMAVEVMDTAAACRTFNVLVAEGRAVAAALVIE